MGGLGWTSFRLGLGGFKNLQPGQTHCGALISFLVCFGIRQKGERVAARVFFVRLNLL